MNFEFLPDKPHGPQACVESLKMTRDNPNGSFILYIAFPSFNTKIRDIVRVMLSTP